MSQAKGNGGPTSGPVVDDTADVLAQKLGEQHQGRAKDAYFYRSHRVYELELDHLVLRSWLYGCHVSQIPDPGDFLQLEFATESILLCRDEGGAVRALVNTCRHRGARVCEDVAGNRRSFTCPYHGWSYGLDGALRGARDMEQAPGFDAADYGLQSLPVCVFEGLVFFNGDPAAVPLEPALQPLARPLGAYRLDSAKVAHRHTYTVAANWKLVLENYLECYHCATAHRAYARMHTLAERGQQVAGEVAALLDRTEAVTGVSGMGDQHRAIYAAARQFGACASHQRYGLKQGFRTGSEDGSPVAPLMGSIRDYDGGAGDFQFGPLTFMLNYPDHCVLYRFLPRDIDTTDMELVWFVRGDAEEGRDYDRERLTWLWHRTTLEDEYIVRRNRAGVMSRYFRPGPYQPEFEAAVMEFDRWYLEALAGATRGA